MHFHLTSPCTPAKVLPCSGEKYQAALIGAEKVSAATSMLGAEPPFVTSASTPGGATVVSRIGRANQESTSRLRFVFAVSIVSTPDFEP